MATPRRKTANTPPRQQASKAGIAGASTLSAALAQQKWITLIGLPILLFATFYGLYSVWGALFIYWGITSIRGGQVFLFEAIDREDDPALFWIISVMWVTSGVTYILADFFPSYFI